VRRFTDNDSLGRKLLHLRVFLEDDLKISGKDGIQPLNLALKRNAYQTKRRVRLVPLSGCGVEPFWMNGDTHRVICHPVKAALVF